MPLFRRSSGPSSSKRHCRKSRMSTITKITTMNAMVAATLLLSATANAFVSPNGLVSNGHVVSSSSNPTTASSPQNSPLRSPTNSDANSASPFSPVSASDSITALHGIPKMFRWLTDQYPNINKRINDGLHVDREVDNFYLDMNGIIHPCTHGNNNDEIIVLDETAMFKKIFSYVDRLYRLVRPRKVLYLAVDGVAPRAKMNQQRSRRFRSSKEAEELAATVLARDGTLPDGKKFDSNCITPGTDFMLKLSIAMKRWVEYKQSTDPFWMSGADVVVTGPDVPGEGEHKVMDYIRECREQYDPDDPSKCHPHWEPGLTHVLYGLDADLIMLGLVTHEPNFLLLREKMSVVMAGRGRHRNRKPKDMLEYTRDDFELLELSALRQMFQIQFRKFADREVLKVEYDVNRIIDDIVFMFMMVGNDFLPHCPHLEIDNGALTLMLNNYIDLLPEWGGYLTDKDKIHPQRFEHLMYHLAAFEEEHFKRRAYEENEPGWALSSDNEQEDTDFYGTWYGGEGTPEVAKVANRRPMKKAVNGDAVSDDLMSADPSKAEKKFKKRHPLDASRSYRDFYYESKLGWSPLAEDRDDTLRKRRAHVRDYLEGLHWNLAYYHKGCASWDWYFPHLYSPLATDMVNLHEFSEEPTEQELDGKKDLGFREMPFEETEPFPSLAQLLSVLPPQSADLLPGPLAELMLEPSSPLAEYYPSDFKSDPNGKRQPWEAVVQIPFIEADVLLKTVNRILEADDNGKTNEDGEQLLSNAERKRNVRGRSQTFCPPRGELSDDQQAEIAKSFAELDRKPPARKGKYNGGGRDGGRGGGGRGGSGRGRGGGRGAGRGRGRTAAAKMR